MNINDQIQSLTETNVRAVITTQTVVKLNKKDVATKSIPNPYAEVIKVSKQLVLLNPLYEKAVNDALTNDGKEADFQAGARQWGENVGNGLVQKGDDFYVNFIWQENIDKSEYHADGQLVDYADIQPFAPIKKPSTNPDVGFRSVKAANIFSLEIL